MKLRLASKNAVSSAKGVQLERYECTMDSKKNEMVCVPQNPAPMATKAERLQFVADYARNEVSSKSFKKYGGKADNYSPKKMPFITPKKYSNSKESPDQSPRKCPSVSITVPNQQIVLGESVPVSAIVTNYKPANSKSKCRYLWSQTNPASPLVPIANATTLNATLGPFTAVGYYTFQIAVTCKDKCLVHDSISIQVINPNTCPTVSVDIPLEVRFCAPRSDITFDIHGVVSDDLLPSANFSWNWSVFPSTNVFINNPSGTASGAGNDVSTSVTIDYPPNDEQYIFTLTVDDGECDPIEASGTLTLVGEVLTANAGQNRTIAFSTGITTLSGFSSSSSLYGVTQLTYLWSQVSGPAGVQLSSPGNITTLATFTDVGVYQFQVLVTSPNGCADVSVVQIEVLDECPTVQLEPNFDVIVCAGASSYPPVTVNGTITDDGYPSTLSWNWYASSDNGLVTISPASDSGANTGSINVSATVSLSNAVLPSTQVLVNLLVEPSGNCTDFIINGLFITYKVNEITIDSQSPDEQTIKVPEPDPALISLAISPSQLLGGSPYNGSLNVTWSESGPNGNFLLAGQTSNILNLQRSDDGEYTFTATVTSEFGCSTSRSFTVFLCVPTETRFNGSALNNEQFGYSVAIQGNTMVVGAYNENSLLPTATIRNGAVYVYENTANDWSTATETKILAFDKATNDQFGVSVAIEGNTIVVGAYRESTALPTATNANGAIYIYEKVTTWAAAALSPTKILASDKATDDGFGISVAIEGNTIVVGSYLESTTPTTYNGAIYVYENIANDWNTAAETKILAFDKGVFDLFGYSVAIQGNTIVVGAYIESSPLPTSTFDSGAIYIYEKVTTWAAAALSPTKITAFDKANGDQFGLSVAIDGNTIVVGAYAEDSPLPTATNDSGAIYIYENIANDWSTATATKITAFDKANFDFFGYSVAIQGNTIVVGCQNADSPGAANSGAIYIYQKGTNWTLGGGMMETKILASDKDTTDLLGSSVAIDGNTIIAGANRKTINGVNAAGAAYVFECYI